MPVSLWIASGVDCGRRAVWNWWTGLLDWNTGMTQTSVKCLLDSSYSISHFTNLLHALFRHLALKCWGESSLYIKLSLSIESGVRLYLVLFKPSTCSKHVEVYLQSLATTIVSRPADIPFS